MEKEYIFPLNYKEKEKFLGVIEYRVLVVLIAFGVGNFWLLKTIDIDMVLKVIFFVTIMIFLSILILVGINGENMLDFLCFVFKFVMRNKVYVYRKTEEKEKDKICISLLKHGSQ